MNTPSKTTYNVAIVGGGITGASATYTLLASSSATNVNLNVHLFDQGRRGVGGRSSHRKHVNVNVNVHEDKDNTNGNGNTKNEVMKWDHGCQFFRADTPRFQALVQHWMTKGIVEEWNGTFLSSKRVTFDFFGLPSQPPFYVGGKCGYGMQGVSQGILELIQKEYILSNSTSSHDHDHDQCENNDDKTSSNDLRVFTGTRVSQLERDDETKKWKLHGTSGEAAFHDTPEHIVQELSKSKNGNGHGNGEKVSSSSSSSSQSPLSSTLYDAVILTDVSSSFGSWHRASAGIPSQFAQRVRERVGARVPLFTAMVALERSSDIPFDAATFHNDTIWFAAKMNSKPGMTMMIPSSSPSTTQDRKNSTISTNISTARTDDTMKECWTLVSTPEYAMEKIEETPMQNPETGSFIPQSDDYLTTVPGPDLWNAFCDELTSPDGILGELDEELVEPEPQSESQSASESLTTAAMTTTRMTLDDIPRVTYLNAQRWGSAMPCHRHLGGEDSVTRRIISNVPYDSGRGALAPTKLERGRDNIDIVDVDDNDNDNDDGNDDDEKTSLSFLVDEDLMLYQAGDMMSSMTPGFESAALSGIDAAESLLQKIMGLR